MFGIGRATFEVQTFDGANWTTREIRETENMARVVAEKMLRSNSSLDGVRVIKNWNRADGILTENVIWTSLRNRQQPKLRAGTVDTAPHCHLPVEYYGLPSRMTMNRVLRQYFDHAVITPSELIHNYQHLKRLHKAEELLPVAVDRIATVQARQVGQDSRARRDELFRRIDEMTIRARRAEKQGLPQLHRDDFGQVVRSINDIAEGEEAEYYSMVVLSSDLSVTRNWIAKLDRLTKLASHDMQPEALHLLDGVMADLLGVPVLLQDILGAQNNLAQALVRMLDLADGRMAVDNCDYASQVSVLNTLFREDRLPECRLSLIHRVSRQLRGTNPLDRATGYEDRAFTTVFRRLMDEFGSLLGGGDMAESLVLRYSRQIEQGGKTGKRLAMSMVTNKANTDEKRTRFLTQLGQSELGQEMAEDVETMLADVVEKKQDIHDFVDQKLPLPEKLRRMTGLHDFVLGSDLPERTRQRIAAHLDTLLARFIHRGRIIEHLDKPDASLRVRATHLVRFCAAGLLPAKGRAAQMARSRVVEYLKRPAFEREFVEDLTDIAQQQASLREFYSHLQRAGFE